MFLLKTECLLIAGGPEKNCENYYLRNFLTIVFFVYNFLLEKNEINVAGKKSWNFCSDLYTFVELFGSAFTNEQKRLYAIFLWRRLTVLLRKMLSVPFDVVLCSKVNFCGKKRKSLSENMVVKMIKYIYIIIVLA